MTLAELHQSWAWVVIAGNGLAGLWALGAVRRPALRTAPLWWFTAAAQLSIFVEVGLGVGMVAGRDVPDLQFHMFYGFIMIVAVGIIYSYRQQLRDRLYLLYGLGGLFVMGLGIRALQVGPR
ncbi:MAG: hypothetical protein AVDCRST_MAG10-2229 [uncultured Acidimicrobiales bacterium]|uniref:GGDEF domain-containing protein n=1 Tax=uncultured Acidimicrobiales bacterium TaxID=310071 RepID=A0A6J4IIC0_9ACTN|nr:MAG: hypothetical protein AVDCRST_MAG10-2229 [uncultured Acidimicrobiales bacterium]